MAHLKTVVAIIGGCGGISNDITGIGEPLWQFGAKVKILILNNEFLEWLDNGNSCSTTDVTLCEHH